jgi:hypothetical protein
LTTMHAAGLHKINGSMVWNEAFREERHGCQRVTRVGMENRN